MLEKKVTQDQIEVIENGIIQVRTKTSVVEDGKELSYSYHRHCISPSDDFSNESAKVKAICEAVHTQEVIDAYKLAQENKVTA